MSFLILVLDLDDTLYPERTFVESGMNTVAHWLSKNYGVPQRSVFLRLLGELDSSGRGRVFDVVLADLNLFSSENIEQCVEIYRGHKPQINLYPGALDAIQRHSALPTYLLTDGFPAVQMRKVHVLGIENHFRRIFTTWSFGRESGKPSLRCFREIVQIEDSSLQEIIYVGDDPNKDFVSLNAVGARTVRVMSGRFADAQAAPGYDAQTRIDGIANLDLLRFPN
jgi:putative hydrolase of the HAD superfamily